MRWVLLSAHIVVFTTRAHVRHILSPGLPVFLVLAICVEDEYDTGKKPSLQFYIGANSALDFWIGSLIMHAWEWADRSGAETYGQVVGAGLLIGDGVWAIPSAILAIAEVSRGTQGLKEKGSLACACRCCKKTHDDREVLAACKAHALCNSPFWYGWQTGACMLRHSSLSDNANVPSSWHLPLAPFTSPAPLQVLPPICMQFWNGGSDLLPGGGGGSAHG